MPELPEVETTRRGIARLLLGQRIAELQVHDARLRWPVAATIPGQVRGQQIAAVGRRAKYLLLGLERGSLILHLGMSGSLRVLEGDTPHRKHDHFDLRLEGGLTLRLNDPRRFGSLHYTDRDPAAHRLLRS